MHLECKGRESLTGVLISSHRAVSSEDQSLEIILRGYPYFLVGLRHLVTLLFFPSKQPTSMQKKIQEWNRVTVLHW